MYTATEILVMIIIIITIITSGQRILTKGRIAGGEFFTGTM